MRPGDEHVIACVSYGTDTMTVALEPEGDLRITIRNAGTSDVLTHYLNHDTARQLFALLGNYLHSWPAP